MYAPYCFVKLVNSCCGKYARCGRYQNITCHRKCVYGQHTQRGRRVYNDIIILFRYGAIASFKRCSFPVCDNSCSAPTSIMFGNISYPPFIQKSIKIIAQNHFMCNGVFLTESEFERQSKPCHLPRPRLRTGVIICCSACAFSCSSEE